ncbi:hypothetical protein ACPWT1_22360 [Ramlibacter sp. MMS24-I3-19]|uniref:hypothetical protein n=1 Tax=Ramlibacter sp. MMS24-I3-19 TaxID=3416606 RepID=UPI003D0617F9
MDHQQIASYLAALAVERRTWAAVEDCLPGTSTYDPVKWKAWRQAVRASDAALHALPRAFPVLRLARDDAQV